MTNCGSIQTRKMKTPANDAKAQTMWLGYCDARAGLPFASEYDGWAEGRQRNYEWGRGLAVAVKAAMGNAPAWPRNRYISRMVPDEITMTEWAHHKAIARHA